MNRMKCLYWLLSVIILAGTCTPEPDGQRRVPATMAFPVSAAADTTVPDSVQVLEIDPGRSSVGWRGTKLVGSGHEGIVRFSDGRLLMSGDAITGGHFVVDMTTIEVTDIPESQPTPRRNLTSHLNSDFATALFPTAEFAIREVTQREGDTWELAGDLSIRGVTRPITVTANRDRTRNRFTSEFTFDRFDWDIGEDGTWLERRLVDAEIQVRVEIHLKQQ